MPHSAIEAYMGGLQRNNAMLRMILGEAARLPNYSQEGVAAWFDDVREKINNGKPQKPVIAPVAVLKMIGIGIRK